MHDDIFVLLQDSLLLLFIGMAVVYSFLAILIVAIKLIQQFCARFPGEEASQKVKSRSPGVSSVNTAASPAVVAAITAAIHQHRQKQ